MLDFDETLLAETLEPLEAAAREFDWESLYARLDADTQDDANEKDLAEAVKRLLQMLLPSPGQQVNPNHVGLRVIALAWVLSPGYFDDNPSLHELAERCGISAATLGKLTGQVSRVIGWRNRSQQRGWNWHRAERRPLSGGHDAERPQARGCASAGERPPGGRGSRATPSAK